MSTSELLQNKINKSKLKPPGLELDLEKLNSGQDFEKNFYDLFRFAFITNCHLDEASVTGEELETLEELTSEEVLENFKDLVNDLLNFKKDYKGSDKAELAQRSEQFENMLQKLEAEVRNHIRIEHQLKLHIESNQNKIEELERYKQEADEKLHQYEGKGKVDSRKTQAEQNKDKIVQKFEVECTKLKSLLEDKVKECEKLKKELEIIKSVKHPEKNSTSIERKKKKSLDENSRNSPSPFRTKKDNDSTLSESRPSTAKKTPSRAHVRSNSDQTRAITSKKMII